MTAVLPPLPLGEGWGKGGWRVAEPSVKYIVQREVPLIRGFEQLATAPSGVARLRELVLELAILGKLVGQDRFCEPAEQLVAKAHAQKASLSRLKVVPTQISESDSSDLPTGWCWSCLGEIGLISPRNNVADDTAASFVQMSSVPIAMMEPHAVETRKWRDIKSGFTHFAEGDVGVAKITPCFENGKSTVFRRLTNGVGAGTTELHVVRPLGGVLPEYILVFLKSPGFLRKGEAVMTGSAGQKRVPRSYFEGSPFPLPPLAEQHRIVARVEELMKLCDALEQSGRLADEQHARLTSTLFDALAASESAHELAENWQRVAEHFDLLLDRHEAIDALEQTILQLAVRGLLVPQDVNDESAVDLLVRIRLERDQLISEGQIRKDKPTPVLGDDALPCALPYSWVWARFGAVVHASEAGWSPNCEGGQRAGTSWGVLKVSAVSWGEFRSYENKELPKHLEARAEFEVRDGDFLISRANTAELVARSVVVSNPEPRLMMSDKIIRLRLSILVDRRFFNLVNNSRLAREYYAANASGTSSSMKNVSREVILGMPVPLPPLAEQHRIVARVEELRRLCAQLRERLIEARRTQSQLADALVAEVG